MAHLGIRHVVANAAKEDVSGTFEGLVVRGGLEGRGVGRFADEGLPDSAVGHFFEREAVAAVAIGAGAGGAGDVFDVFEREGDR